MRLSPRWAITLAGLCWPAVAAAQTAPDIVVTGRGLDARPDLNGYDSVEIDRDRLTQSASNRLEDALADVAGLASFRRSDSRSANPTSQGITLRGIGGNAASRALLVLDGVPQADPFAGWIAFPAYAPGRLARVRVVRGGGSGLWGPGALTGTIELESAGPDDLAPVSAALSYGSRNAIDAALGIAARGGGGFATIDAQYQRGDGFAPIANGGPVDRAAPYEQKSLALRGVTRIDPATEVQAAIQLFSDLRDRGLDFTAIKSDGADASVRVVHRGPWRWSALGYVQTRRFASRFASVNADRTVVTPTLDQYQVPGTGLGGRIDIEPPLGGGFTLRVGSDVRALSGETRERFTYVAGSPTRQRQAGGATRTLGGFADLGWRSGAVSVDLSGRIDAWRISGGHLYEAPIAGGPGGSATFYPDRDGIEPTGRAALVWGVAHGVELRVAGYRGWRLPTLNELYRPFRAGADATAANPALRPEHLTGIDGGVRLRSGNIDLSVTGFADRLEDAIANVTVAAGPIACPGVGQVGAAGSCRRRDNLTAITAHGLEVEAGYRRGILSTRLSYSYVDARVVARGAFAALDGRRPAQVPAHQLSATLGLGNAPHLHGALTGRYIAGQFEDDQNGRALRGAFTLDAFVAVPLIHGVTLEARGENLGDATVDAGFSNSLRERARPRSLWIGLRAALGR